MFISISIDLATEDSKLAIRKIFKQYGIKKIHQDLYESTEFPTKTLGNLKKDIIDAVDMDDKVRMYQFPLEDCFKISYLEDRKWKRLSISSNK